MTTLKSHTCPKRRGLSPPPCWLMRQAGRYLQNIADPFDNGEFFRFLFYSRVGRSDTPTVASLTFDGAIMFSDILVIPMMVRVTFKKGEGLTDALKTSQDIAKLDLSW